jgi:D-alanyl-D-alanine carboxypeptidase
MVATLKKSGVTQIAGNVLIDTSIFASHDKAPGWPWNDMTQCFSAPPAAAIVDRNCFSVSLYSAQTQRSRLYSRGILLPGHHVQSGAYSPEVLRKRNIVNWMWFPAISTAIR